MVKFKHIKVGDKLVYHYTLDEFTKKEKICYTIDVVTETNSITKLISVKILHVEDPRNKKRVSKDRVYNVDQTLSQLDVEDIPEYQHYDEWIVAQEVKEAFNGKA